MPLADWQIASRCDAGMVEGYDPDLINPASLDVRLGDSLLIESAQTRDLVPYPLSKHTEDNPYELRPGQFCLAQTMEVFNLPNDVAAQFMLKSSRAREGLEHLMAGYCDPGWHGSVLTLELHNSRQLWPQLLWPGMRVGQVIFHLMVEHPARSYATTGRYNMDQSVQSSKG